MDAEKCGLNIFENLYVKCYQACQSLCQQKIEVFNLDFKLKSFLIYFGASFECDCIVFTILFISSLLYQ